MGVAFIHFFYTADNQYSLRRRSASTPTVSCAGLYQSGYVLVHEYDNLFAFLTLCPLLYIASLQAKTRNPVINACLSHSQEHCMFPQHIQCFYAFFFCFVHQKVHTFSHYQNILPAIRGMSPVSIIRIIIIFLNYTAVLQIVNQMSGDL